jgi:nucleoid-associated protein YgaU
VSSFSSTLTIQELAQDGVTVLRAVTLQGPGLPHMGASWPFQNKLETTWYPGNQDEATQQVMGREELPSTWSGEWNRTRMGRTPSRILDVTSGQGGTDVVDPFALNDFLEQLYSSGRRLRVTWACEQLPGGNDVGGDTASFSGKIVREGRCKQHKPAYRTAFDIEWETTFEWVSRGASTARVTSPRDASIGNNSAAYVAALDAIVAANQQNANTATPNNLTLGQLEALASTPTTIAEEVSRSMLKLENELSQIVSLGSTLAQQPRQVAQAAIDHGRNAQAIADASYRSLSCLGVETMTTQSDAASVLAAHQNFAQMQQAQLQASTAAWAFLQQVRASLPRHASALQGELGPQAAGAADTIQHVYVVKQGDTAPRISQRFYGTPDHADAICQANNLAWHTYLLPPGKIIVIPDLSTIAQTV